MSEALRQDSVVISSFTRSAYFWRRTCSETELVLCGRIVSRQRMTEMPGSIESESTTAGCVFCALEDSRIAWSSGLAIAAWDGYAVSPGHALVIPRRHVELWDDLSTDEKVAVISGIDAIRAAAYAGFCAKRQRTGPTQRNERATDQSARVLAETSASAQ